VLNDRNLAAARVHDQAVLAPTVTIVLGGVMKTMTKEKSTERWTVAFQNKSTILNPRWVFETASTLTYRYDGIYGGSKFLAQAEFGFDEKDKIFFVEYTIITGFERVEGVVGRGVRTVHGANPTQEAHNVKVVNRRIAVLNARVHNDAVRLVDECFSPSYISNHKCVWSPSPGRNALIKAFDDAFAAKSTILKHNIRESGVTSEKVDYSYHGLYNGASYVGFCTTVFTESGKILSECWRVKETQ